LNPPLIAIRALPHNLSFQPALTVISRKTNGQRGDRTRLCRRERMRGDLVGE
jgi:hypothetical protein